MITPATPQLLDLAEAVRGTAWRDRLEVAMAAARVNGWPWPRAASLAVRLMLTEDAEPRDLAEAARDPLRRDAVPGDHRAGLAACLAAIEQAGASR